MIMQWIFDLFKRYIVGHRCPSRLALAFSIGIYIAFSPFILLHNILIIALAWACNLNFAVIYVSSHLVNNPWTMVAVYAADYYIGKALLTFFGCERALLANPAWVEWLNGYLTYYVGIPQISFWAFMLGGNVLGILASLMAYPVFVRLFTRMLAAQSVPSLQ